jgi:uroporphyrinogen III methyltransferase/synthase
LSGKVWLVGSGPGDPELLTVKGRRILEQADTVVYDRLAGTDVLHYARRAELIDVGKRGGFHPIPQDEIEKILIEKAEEGKNVVRLQGGDPFLFGRGGEEIAALRLRGIPCEVVPGVTSAIAVPAYAGIPVTHRGCSSALHIVAAHRRKNGEPVDYSALARVTRTEGTLVFLMGASRLREICERLVEAGMDEKTPAAVIERGTTARQKQITGTLSDLPDRGKEVRSPAVIVVGQVVALSETLNWRSDLPLAGKRVLTAEPDAAARKKRTGERLANLLRSRGAEVAELSFSKIEASDVPFPPLGGYGWLVFTSAAGVEFFFERLRTEHRDIREIGAAKIAAVGSATRNAAEMYGLKVDLVPSTHNGAALGKALLSEWRSAAKALSFDPLLFAAKKRLLLLRAERPAPELTRVLKEGGLEFDEVPLYRTVLTAQGRTAGSECFDDADAVVFTCSSSVHAFAAACPNIRVEAICIGPRTAKAAVEAGYSVTVAKEATLEALTDAVEKILNSFCRRTDNPPALYSLK